MEKLRWLARENGLFLIDLNGVKKEKYYLVVGVPSANKDKPALSTSLTKKMKRILTLCIIYQDRKILLGMKKRGFGVGKWNGFGGHVEEAESIEEAAKREVFEEAGLKVKKS